MKPTFRSYLAAIADTAFLAGCHKNNQYECIEPSEKEVPDHMGPGSYTEVEHVLLHDGDKIYASCDVSTVSAEGNELVLRKVGDGWGLSWAKALTIRFKPQFVRFPAAFSPIGPAVVKDVSTMRKTATRSLRLT